MMQSPAASLDESAPRVHALVWSTLALFAVAMALMVQPGDGRDDWVLAGDRLTSSARFTAALALYAGAETGGGYGAGLDVRVGRLHLAKGRLSLAEEWLGRAVQRCAAAAGSHPLDRPPLSACQGEARRLLGLLYARTARPEDAALLLSQAVDGGVSEAAYPLAMVRLRLGQDRAAADVLESESRRGSPRATLALALLTAPSDLSAAVALLNATAHGPDAAVASAAARLIAESLAWTLAEDPAYRALLVGRSALKAGLPEAALANFAASSRVDPGYAQAHAYQAFALYSLGDDQRALIACSTALRLDPTDSQALHTRGLILWRQGSPTDARDALELALASDPANAAILGDLADVYAALHQYDQAASDLAAAVRLDPTSPVPLLRLARFHLESLVAVPLGLEAARAALSLAPESADATDLVGWGRYLSGEWTEAAETLRRAVMLAPSSAEAHYHLGMAEWRAGNLSAARLSLQQAIDLDSTGAVETRAQAAISRLR